MIVNKHQNSYQPTERISFITRFNSQDPCLSTQVIVSKHIGRYFVIREHQPKGILDHFPAYQQH